MPNNNDQSRVPGYVSIKEAAKILGLSPSRVYEYVEDGRFSSVRAAHVILIPLEEVERYKPSISGRPRKSVPRWRISPEDNLLLSTTILVQLRPHLQELFIKRLEEMKRSDLYLFPGTIARFITQSETKPGQVEISLVWRKTVMPTEEERERALEELRQALSDVLDWDTAQYNQGQVLMHT
jgi:excisionase family DNA binding protein